MAVIREVAFGDGTSVRILDWGDYPLFSRGAFDAANIAAGNLQRNGVILFNYTVGGQIPMTNERATYADTNMPAASQLPMGHQMLVYGVQVIPDEFAYVDDDKIPNPSYITPEATVSAAYWKWRKIFHQTYLKLIVEQTKSFVEGWIHRFPAGGGMLITSAHNAAEEDRVYPGYDIHNGDRTWEASRGLSTPVHLGSLENFQVELSWPRGLGEAQADPSGGYFDISSGFDLTVVLTGPRQRPTA